MIKINPYNKEFYNTQITPSYKSASVIVPILIDLFDPKSVVDVGCGMGTWLKVFQENNIQDILGIDGDYIDKNKLLIPNNKFQANDLKFFVQLNRIYDLVISLEVAEHLPQDSADSFIDTLTSLGHIIYFSASIPFQGGTNHLNEQWQSYWAIKFKERNFFPLDIIRPRVWDDNNVQTCYAQNGIIYIKKERLALLNSRIINSYQSYKSSTLSIVHPKIYEGLVDPLKQTVRTQLIYFSKVLLNRFMKRIKIK